MSRFPLPLLPLLALALAAGIAGCAKKEPVVAGW